MFWVNYVEQGGQYYKTSRFFCLGISNLESDQESEIIRIFLTYRWVFIGWF